MTTSKTAALVALNLSTRIIQDSTSRMFQWFVCSELGNDDQLVAAMTDLSNSVDKLETIVRGLLGK